MILTASCHQFVNIHDSKLIVSRYVTFNDSKISLCYHSSLSVMPLNFGRYPFYQVPNFLPLIHNCAPQTLPYSAGLQQTRVVCVKSDSQVEVIKENCDPALTPEVTTVRCNTDPCKPR